MSKILNRQRNSPKSSPDRHTDHFNTFPASVSSPMNGTFNSSSPRENSPGRTGRVRPSAMYTAGHGATAAAKFKQSVGGSIPHYMQKTHSPGPHSLYPHHSQEGRLSPSSSKLGNHQQSLRVMQQARQNATQKKGTGNPWNAVKNTMKEENPQTYSSTNSFGYSTGGLQSADQIKLERNRLLKEKQQWLSHVKKENDVLMSLLADVRSGKVKIKAEMEKLTAERNEIKTLKMDNIVHHFEKTLSELPLGERGNFARDHEPIENQHKTDGVHSLMCSIARRARAIQEQAIKELVEAIRNTEETFLEGGDITMRIHDLKAMADGIGGHGGDDVSESTGGGDCSHSPRTNANTISSNGSVAKGKRTSLFGTRKGVSFQMNSTANVIAAMTNQADEMDKRFEELEEEKEKWKAEFISLRRKMMKMNVINAITRIGREAVNEKHTNGAPPQEADPLSPGTTEFVIPDGTKGWDSLPENWRKVALKALKHHIKKRASQHVRKREISEVNLHAIQNETAEHMKEIFGHMLYTTATSSAGIAASAHNMNHLCDAILNSLAMERELYPLLTMYMTYGAESPYIKDRREDPTLDDHPMADELAEVEELEKRFSAEAKSRTASSAPSNMRESQKSVGSDFDYSKTASSDSFADSPPANPKARSKNRVKMHLNHDPAPKPKTVKIPPPPQEETAAGTTDFNSHRTYSAADNALYDGIEGLD
ncbi:hypothetical protein TrVE_jg211 [Triparma verrucosa]|uniref:Uncharacterized protein n=1 Tax=Triparma verrucosa TaxID=1606542 RepID=A0A9W7CE05_9STRA|nr:hypothetical protein TrVE_jg211 [Triparma verrucosa]